MITLKTITSIELSSLCNMACRYCINSTLTNGVPNRKPGIMNEVVFDLSLQYLKQLWDNGTQKEVNLNGNGESLLDPDICKRIDKIRALIGDDIMIMLCTNALNMTLDLAKSLKDAGINRIDLSIHSPYHARKAMYMLIEAGITGVVNTGVIMNSHNWAGQLAAIHQIRRKYLPKINCDPLIQGMGYIQSDGFISPCCYDFKHLGSFGHVSCTNLLDHEIKPFTLCKSCHQKIPIEILQREKVQWSQFNFQEK